MCLAAYCRFCKEITTNFSYIADNFIVHPECDINELQLKLFGTQELTCKAFCPDCARALWHQSGSLIQHYDEHEGYLHKYIFKCICGKQSSWSEYIHYVHPEKDKWILNTSTDFISKKEEMISYSV